MTPTPRTSSRRPPRPTRCCRTPTGAPPMTATATTGCAAAATRRTSRASARSSDIFEAFFGGGAGGGGFGSIFGGGAAGGPAQGGDVAVSAEITLKQAAEGAAVEVAYDAVARCEHCHGNGAEPGTPIETCPKCEGTGQLRRISRTPFGQVVQAAACDQCGGDGKIAQRRRAANARAAGRKVERGQGRRSTFPRGSTTASGSGSPAAATPASTAAPPATCTSRSASARTRASCATRMTS